MIALWQRRSDTFIHSYLFTLHNLADMPIIRYRRFMRNRRSVTMGVTVVSNFLENAISKYSEQREIQETATRIYDI